MIQTVNDNPLHQKDTLENKATNSNTTDHLSYTYEYSLNGIPNPRCVHMFTCFTEYIIERFSRWMYQSTRTSHKIVLLIVWQLYCVLQFSNPLHLTRTWSHTHTVHGDLLHGGHRFLDGFLQHRLHRLQLFLELCHFLTGRQQLEDNRWGWIKTCSINCGTILLSWHVIHANPATEHSLEEQVKRLFPQFPLRESWALEHV